MIADVKNSKIDDLYTEEQMENYLLAVYTGLISVDQLSIEYHEKIGGLLYDAIRDGFGGDIFLPETVEIATFSGLSENVYVFSAAKQYQQVRQMSNIINDMGEKATFTDFKKMAGEVFEDYNKNYLQSEFQTAIGQAQSARDWVQIQNEKDLFPLLQYRTQDDSLVRESHQVLNNIVRPVNDSFWNTRMPKNGWRCRCFTKQLEQGEVTPIPDNIPDKDFPTLFQMNPGKDKIIFDPSKHPYFNVGRGDAPLRRNDFNLPIPR